MPDNASHMPPTESILAIDATYRLLKVENNNVSMQETLNTFKSISSNPYSYAYRRLMNWIALDMNYRNYLKKIQHSQQLIIQQTRRASRVSLQSDKKALSPQAKRVPGALFGVNTNIEVERKAHQKIKARENTNENKAFGVVGVLGDTPDILAAKKLSKLKRKLGELNRELEKIQKDMLQLSSEMLELSKQQSQQLHTTKQYVVSDVMQKQPNASHESVIQLVDKSFDLLTSSGYTQFGPLAPQPKPVPGKKNKAHKDNDNYSVKRLKESDCKDIIHNHFKRESSVLIGQLVSSLLFYSHRTSLKTYWDKAAMFERRQLNITAKHVQCQRNIDKTLASISTLLRTTPSLKFERIYKDPDQDEENSLSLLVNKIPGSGNLT